jgi:ABC-type sugar transport system substrate-binding protein
MPDRRIALFLRASGNDYQDLLREDCMAAVKRHGFQLQIFSGDDDAERQVHQIHEVLAAPRTLRPAALLVSPVRESMLLTVAHEAARAGVGWIMLNRWNDTLLELRGEFPELPIFAVNPDQSEVGRIQGQQFRALLPRGGEVLYVQGPLGTSSAYRRFAGMQEEIAGAAINVVTFNSDWSIEGGEAATHEWLRIFGGRPLPLCVVGAQSDNMAEGARKAIAEWASDVRASQRIPVTGCDGSPSYGQRLVKNGQLTATVVIPPVAGRAIDEIAATLDQNRIPPAEIVVRVTSYPALALLARSAVK